MDSSTAEAVNPYEGKSFLEICEELFLKCRFMDHRTAAFEAIINYIEYIHEVFDVPFDRREYLSAEKLTGSHSVWPPELVRAVEAPEEITVEYVDRMTDLFSRLSAVQGETRQAIQRMSSSNRGSEGLIESRTLERTVYAAPVHVVVNDSDDDDFL